MIHPFAYQRVFIGIAIPFKTPIQHLSQNA